MLRHVIEIETKVLVKSHAKECAVVSLITISQLTIVDLGTTIAGDHGQHELYSWDHQAYRHGGHK